MVERPAADRVDVPGRRAKRWQLRTRQLAFGFRPSLMGILNVTPDSFSDGGDFFDPSAAVDHGLRLVDEGADLLDLGGESTRPYSKPVDAKEELRRVLPVLNSLVRQTDVPISIDTSKSAVARAAIDAGVEIVNDVTGLQGDCEMLPLALATRVGVCVMHMQGTPQTMQDDPAYDDIVEDIHRFLLQRRDALEAAGLRHDRICLDPGIGFGKTHQHNLTLLANCHRFHTTDCPLLVGHSRKGFIGKVLDDKNADRGHGTIGVTLALAAQGVQVIRVHDVRGNREALALFEAAGGIESHPESL